VFQLWTVEHYDPPAVVTDDTGQLELAGGLR
jgi:hypothetical protein